MLGRGNGLHAASYKPLIDLDPQLADAMLDALRDEGVAAYAAPAGTAMDLPVQTYRGPTDRLWVDAEARDHANAVLQTRLPGLQAQTEGSLSGPPRTSEPGAGSQPEATAPLGLGSPSGADPASAGRRMGGTAPAEGTGVEPTLDEEQAWAEIVASFDAVPGDQVPRWPVAEDVDERHEEEHLGDRDARPAPGGRLLWPSRDLIGREAEPPGAGCCGGGCGCGKDSEVFEQDVDELEDGEHFIPPTPPPLPEIDTVAKFAWAAALGAPLYFVVAALLGWQVTDWSGVLAVAAFVGGFVVLVARLKDRRSFDDPDDGAIV